MTVKQKIYNHYYQLLRDRENLLLQILSDLKESAGNETKSTAGDKYETALAMLQIEQANYRAQLLELQIQKAVFEKINPQIKTEKILPGSLVKTDLGIFFLCIALGKACIDGKEIMAISPQSPLGQKLLGSKKNDKIEMNKIHYTIEDIE
jgi:Transcription elongation factor, GreA/GreB, C-term